MGCQSAVVHSPIVWLLKLDPSSTIQRALPEKYFDSKNFSALWDTLITSGVVGSAEGSGDFAADWKFGLSCDRSGAQVRVKM
jgi:hypothetical protein